MRLESILFTLLILSLQISKLNGIKCFQCLGEECETPDAQDCMRLGNACRIDWKGDHRIMVRSCFLDDQQEMGDRCYDNDICICHSDLCNFDYNGSPYTLNDGLNYTVIQTPVIPSSTSGRKIFESMFMVAMLFQMI